MANALSPNELLGLRIGFYHCVSLLKKAALNITFLSENSSTELRDFMKEVESFGLILTSVSSSASLLRQFPEILHVQQQELSSLLEAINAQNIHCSNLEIQKCLSELEALVASLLALLSIHACLATFQDYN